MISKTPCELCTADGYIYCADMNRYAEKLQELNTDETTDTFFHLCKFNSIIVGQYSHISRYER